MTEGAPPAPGSAGRAGRRGSDVTTALPVAVGLFAVAVLSAMDAVIKEASAGIGTPQVVLMRYAFGLLACAAAAPQRSGGEADPGDHAASRLARRVHRLDGLFLLQDARPAAAAEAIAITFTAPFFMLVASRILLGEAMPPRALGAIGIGFLGVLVMVAGAARSAASTTGSAT